MAVVVIGTYRDTDLDATLPLARTLDDLTRRRLLRRIPLDRLTEDVVTAMLRARSGQEPPNAIVDVIYRETEGNPFFVEETFQYLAEEGKLFDEAGQWRTDLEVSEVEVPEGVRLAVAPSEALTVTLAGEVARWRAAGCDVRALFVPLRGELVRTFAPASLLEGANWSPPRMGEVFSALRGARYYRYEVNHQYYGRWLEALSRYREDHGELPAGNLEDPEPLPKLGRFHWKSGE